MKLIILEHVLDRMEEYGISEEQVIETIHHPDSIVPGHNERKIHQKRLNGHILRVVLEENEEILRVITTYKARSDRYEV